MATYGYWLVVAPVVPIARWGERPMLMSARAVFYLDMIDLFGRRRTGRLPSPVMREGGLDR